MARRSDALRHLSAQWTSLLRDTRRRTLVAGAMKWLCAESSSDAAVVSQVLAVSAAGSAVTSQATGAPSIAVVETVLAASVALSDVVQEALASAVLVLPEGQHAVPASAAPLAWVGAAADSYRLVAANAQVLRIPGSTIKGPRLKI